MSFYILRQNNKRIFITDIYLIDNIIYIEIENNNINSLIIKNVYITYNNINYITYFNEDEINIKKEIYNNISKVTISLNINNMQFNEYINNKENNLLKNRFIFINENAILTINFFGGNVFFNFIIDNNNIKLINQGFMIR